jgi:CRP/FNR family transcriptional regulator/CRP/FNR family cyclic AMP-dependent transcriptional regulator
VVADERLDFLRTISLFSEMEHQELVRLAADLHPRSVPAGEAIFFQGDPGEALYLIVAGRVRIYLHAVEGQEVSVVLYGRGDVFGEMSLLDQRPRSATAVSMDDAELLVMGRDAFYRHLRSSSQMALNVMLTLSSRLRDTTESFKSLASLDVNSRIAKRLLRLARRQGVFVEGGIRIPGPLTQQALASLIGASRESTNRALRALERKGLIEVREGQLVLLRTEELEQLVGIE